MALKLTPEGIQRYIERIEAAWESDYVNGWEMSFLNDIQERLISNEHPRLSEKQWNRLNIILEKCGT